MYNGKDELTVIQEDIRRAIKKPSPQWAMLIDLRRCTSCKACVAGCIAEQKSPPGIIYRPVYEEESGTYPKVKRRFTPRPCQQCDNPPCVAACPNKGEGKATWKSTKGLSSGIVMINYTECIGCGKCVTACPYKARGLDSGKFYTEDTPAVQEYEKAPTWEYSRKWPRNKPELPIGTARKCHFCLHRLKQGMVPMCVSTCICRANYFGDIKDPESLIVKMMKENRTRLMSSVKSEVIKGKSATGPEALSKQIGYPGKLPVFGESAPTKPRVYYILS
jgi:molybdopterin-containing oxidoreductase family iron-sulfur binding subunit